MRGSPSLYCRCNIERFLTCKDYTINTRSPSSSASLRALRWISLGNETVEKRACPAFTHLIVLRNYSMSTQQLAFATDGIYPAVNRHTRIERPIKQKESAISCTVTNAQGNEGAMSFDSTASKPETQSVPSSSNLLAVNHSLALSLLPGLLFLLFGRLSFDGGALSNFSSFFVLAVSFGVPLLGCFLLPIQLGR